MRSFILALVLFAGFTVKSQTAEVIGENAFLRGAPAATGAVVDTLAPAARVTVIKQQGPWFLVQSSPFVGWMHGNSLRLIKNSRTGLASRSTAGMPKPPQTPAKTQDPPVGKAPAPNQPPAASPQKKEAVDERVYVRGPRGGCYYVRPDGKKVYSDHSRCT